MNNPFAHLTARIAALETQLQNVLQIAKVTVVDDTTNLLDLEVRGVPLTGVPFLTTRAGTMGQTYWLPEVGELGMLLSPGGDVANCVFLPAMFYDTVPAPENDANIMRRRFTNVAEEKWSHDDNRHVLQLDSNAKRQTDQEPAKIEDNAGQSKVTLDSAGSATIAASPTAKLEIQQSGNAELAATAMAKIVLSAVVANIVGLNIHPTGITTIMSPMGPCFFAPVPAPTSPPSPPAGSAPDSDGNVTQTPPSTITGITVNAGSSLSFILPAVPVTTPVGPGATVPTAVSVTITSGTFNLTFPSQSLDRHYPTRRFKTLQSRLNEFKRMVIIGISKTRLRQTMCVLPRI